MKLKILLLACGITLFVSCEKERALDWYYNQEGNFSGSIYDALDSAKLFKQFLIGIDSTEYANQLKYTLITIAAPSDKAFEAYFQKHGYSSISDVPKDELQDLIGHHIVTWPQEPDVFTNEPNLFKRQTGMAPGTVVKYDIKIGADRTVLQESKYLQFYTPQMLNIYRGTEEDYSFFTGRELSPATGFNIYDAQVDSIGPYGNGWIYYVDKVIEPYKNLDDWLMAAPDYSMFNHMFNRFSLYLRDGNVPTDLGVNIKRSNLFQNRRHYRIDMELCFETVGSSNELGDIKIFPKGSSNFTVVAPQNNLLEEFIDNTFTGYPGFKEQLMGIEDNTLPGLHVKLVARAIISPYMFLELPVWPSNLYAGDFNGSDGTNFKLNPDNIVEKILCSNGYGYGINSFIVPRTFKSILRPVYTSPDYKFFTGLVDQFEINSFLNDKGADYTLMLPNDSAFLNSFILMLTDDEFINDFGGEIRGQELGLAEYIFYKNDTRDGGVSQQMVEQELSDIIFNHLFIGSVTPSDQKQYALNASGNFVGITNNNVWSGGNVIGRKGSRTVLANVLEIISDVDNGRVFVIDELIQPPQFSIGQVIREVPEYSRFRDLCENAGLYVDGELVVFGEKPTLFIPTNDAIDQYIADGKLPSTEEELQRFLKYFFVNQSMFTSETINNLTLETLSTNAELTTEFQTVYRTVEVNGTYENMQIKGSNNSSFINVAEGTLSNMICTDGIVHQIDGVLN